MDKVRAVRLAESLLQKTVANGCTADESYLAGLKVESLMAEHGFSLHDVIRPLSTAAEPEVYWWTPSEQYPAYTQAELDAMAADDWIYPDDVENVPKPDEWWNGPLPEPGSTFEKWMWDIRWFWTFLPDRLNDLLNCMAKPKH